MRERRPPNESLARGSPAGGAGKALGVAGNLDPATLTPSPKMSSPSMMISPGTDGTLNSGYSPLSGAFADARRGQSACCRSSRDVQVSGVRLREFTQQLSIIGGNREHNRGKAEKAESDAEPKHSHGKIIRRN
jgi:hypothetical protein